MLDDENGVAGIDDRIESAGEHGDVGDLETDGGLVEHVEDTGHGAAGELLCELEPLSFAARETPAGLAHHEVSETERERGVADASHGADVAPFLYELGDGEGLDVGERAAALDEGGDLGAVAGAAARVTGLGHRRQEPHALVPRAFAVAGVAAVAEVFDRDALFSGDFARSERFAHGVDEPEEHAG